MVGRNCLCFPGFQPNINSHLVDAAVFGYLPRSAEDKKTVAIHESGHAVAGAGNAYQNEKDGDICMSLRTCQAGSWSTRIPF